MDSAQFDLTSVNKRGLCGLFDIKQNVYQSIRIMKLSAGLFFMELEFEWIYQNLKL